MGTHLHWFTPCIGAFYWGNWGESEAGGKYGYMFHLTNTAWQWPLSCGAAASTMPAAPPHGTQHGDIQHLGRTGFQHPIGDLCCGVKDLRNHTLDGYEDPGRVVLSHMLGVWRRLLQGSSRCGQESKGEVGIISQEWPEGWIVESMRFHCTNVVSWDIVAGDQQNPLIGSYLPQSTLDPLPNLEDVLNRLTGRYPVVLGDLNTDIACLRNPWDKQAPEFLASFGLVDILAHFW